MSNELADRLRRAAPSPSRELTAAALAGETRHHRRRTTLGAAALTLVVVAATLIATLTGGGSSSEPASIAAVPSAPTGPSISVVPGNGLVDGQQVTVSGSGFTAKTNLAIVMCGSESVGLSDPSNACATDDNASYVTTDGAGDFSTSYGIHRSITTPKTGVIDCAARPGRCRLGVGGVTSRKGIAAALTFRSDLPALAAPKVVLKTTGQLSDGSAVTVVGTGFGARRQVGVHQCLTTNDCEGDAILANVTTDAAGGFTAVVTVHEKINSAGDEAWCSTSCLLFAAVQPEPTNPSAASPSFSLEPAFPDGGVACQLSTLKATYGGLRTAQSGAPSLAFNLQNSGPMPCWLDGYPNVQLLQMEGPASGVGSFYGSSAAASVKIGGVGITEQPGPIRLDPQASAHFRVVKNDCAATTEAIANSLDFSPSGGSSVIRIPAADAKLALPACHTSVSNIFHVGPFLAGTG